jgi:hypothetical protein
LMTRRRDAGWHWSNSDLRIWLRAAVNRGGPIAWRGKTPRPGIEPGFSVCQAEIITAPLPRIWIYWEGKKNHDLGKIWRAGE